MTIAGEARQETLSSLDHALHSQTFSSCESLRRILKFVVEKSLSGHDDEIKEYTIATEVLGRPADFDPRIDTIVRVQMQRLRRKLEEYYRQEGATDPIRIVIPRGNYAPEIRAYLDSTHVSPAAVPSLAPEANQPITRSNKWLTVGIPWGLVILLSLFIFVTKSGWLRLAESSIQTPRATAKLPNALSPLWNLFLPPNPPPLIVYSNALFLIDGAGDLYRCVVNSGISLPTGARVLSLIGVGRQSPIPPGVGPLYYMDTYAGTGEVVAAARIAQLLASRNQKFSIRRNRIVSYDDIKSTNVIFIGATFEDSILRQLPVESDLTFEQMDDHELSGLQDVIHDRHPSAGHPDSYALLRDAKTGTIEGDYALVSLLPGLTPDRHIMVLGGITTIGTEAAADFVTSPDNMALLDRMRPKEKTPDPHSYFQALLRVQVREGEPAKTECVFVRNLNHN